MNFDGYVTHIIQKLKLAVSIAIIQTKPDNLTIKEHIDELSSNFFDKMDEDFDISICSDDFDLDFNISHEEIQNNNIEDDNCSLSIINHNIEESMINNSDTNIVNQSVNEINNREANSAEKNNSTHKNNSNNYQISNKDTIDCKHNNTAIITNNMINNSIFTNSTIQDNNTRNEVSNSNNQNTQDYYDIIFDNDNMMIINNNREEVMNSPTMLEDFENLIHENFLENMQLVEDSVNGNNDINRNKKNLSQDIFNASQNNDLNQCSNITYCKTIENTDLTHENTQKDVTVQINENNKNSNNISSSNNNLKHVIELDEDSANPKKKINLELEAKTPNISPDAKFRSNVTKFLQNNKMVAKTITDKSKTKIDTENEILIENANTVNSKTKVRNVETEFTQNTSYSQSQPLFQIDRKYMYENRNRAVANKYNTATNTLQPEDNQNIIYEENIKDIDSNFNKVNTDLKLTDREHKLISHNKDVIIIQEEAAYINDIAQEKVTGTHKNKKIISNDTDMNFQGEICLFSQNVSNGFEKNTTNLDNTQDLYNNFVTTNNLTQHTEINTTKNIKDVKSSLTLRQDEKEYELRFKNKEIIQEINGNSPRTHNRIETKDNPNNVIDLRQDELKSSITNNLKTKDALQKDNLTQNLSQSTTRIKDVKLQENSTQILTNMSQNSSKMSQQIPNSNFSKDTQIERQNSNSSEIDLEEEIIPFKVIEELNKIKNYLNKMEAKSTDESSDTGYRSDSQSKSLKSTQPHIWLNQSAHSLFNYIATCPLIHTTEDITKEVSIVLGQLIDKLHDNEQYPAFLEEMLEATDLMVKLIYEDNFEDNQLLKKDENVQRILLLTKSTHIQKYTIEKITTTLENLLQILTSKDSIQEITNIQKIENSCYLFHILHILLQKYFQKTVNIQKNTINSQKTGINSQNSQYSSQFSNSSHKKLNSSQYSSQNSLNSQSIKKSDISDIWRKKWNPNFKELSLGSDVERKCVLSECSKVLNSLIVNCMDGFSLIAYFSLKCFNLMQN